MPTKFNYDIILKDITKSRTITRQVNKFAGDDFREKKADMLDVFLRHPITQEIQEGPTATNTTRTLDIANKDHGNLFSFLGFEAGSDPIGKALGVIDENTRLFPVI